MPLYDYRCPTCKQVVEVRHGFDDTYAQACAACGGELQRVFNPAPILFKGSGFYVTDSRKKESASDAPAAAPPASASAPAAAPAAPASTPGPSSKESAA